MSTDVIPLSQPVSVEAKQTDFSCMRTIINCVFVLGENLSSLSVGGYASVVFNGLAHNASNVVVRVQIPVDAQNDWSIRLLGVK